MCHDMTESGDAAVIYCVVTTHQQSFKSTFSHFYMTLFSCIRCITINTVAGNMTLLIVSSLSCLALCGYDAG